MRDLFVWIKQIFLNMFHEVYLVNARPSYINETV